MTDYLEIRFWKVARWLIIRGYGEPCDEFDEECSCCRAGKVLEWIDGHIDLLKM